MVTQSRRKVVRFIFRGRHSGQTEHGGGSRSCFERGIAPRVGSLNVSAWRGHTNVAVIDDANWSNNAGIRQAGLQRISLRET